MSFKGSHKFISTALDYVTFMLPHPRQNNYMTKSPCINIFVILKKWWLKFGQGQIPTFELGPNHY